MEEAATKKKKGRAKRVVYAVIMIVLISVFAFCAYKIISIQIEYNESKEIFEAVADKVINKIEVPPSPDDPDAEFSVDIDFDELTAQCSDIFAWIY